MFMSISEVWAGCFRTAAIVRSAQRRAGRTHLDLGKRNSKDWMKEQNDGGFEHMTDTPFGGRSLIIVPMMRAELGLPLSSEQLLKKVQLSN